MIRIIALILFFQTVAYAIPEPFIDCQPSNLMRGEVTKVCLPIYPHASDSLAIRSFSNEQRFKNWTDKEHRETYRFLQKIVRLWKDNGYAKDYLVMGKTSPSLRSETFAWEVVPFENNGWSTLKQLKVIWRSSFGVQPQADNEQQLKKVQTSLLTKRDVPISEKTEQLPDPFSDPKVLEKQTIFSGKNMAVLYDLKPGRVLEEVPHFLIIPKQHRQTFADLTEDEYAEAMAHVERLVAYFQEEYPRSTLYLLHKNGQPAGQTVGRWHLHVIALKDDAYLPSFQFPCNKNPSSCTRLNSPFLKINQLFGELMQGSKNLIYLLLPHQKLTDEEMKERVAYYKEAFHECDGSFRYGS